MFVPITPKGLGSTSPSTYCAGRLSGLRNQGLFRRSLSLVAWATPVTVYKLILNDDGIHLVPMDADATAGPQSENEGW
jgi:hypothetical protein